MKRKTLFIILLIPFIVAILGFVNVILIKNYVEVDIAGIEWNYEESNGFKLRKDPYKLEATPIIDETLELSDGNDLMWFIPEEYENNGVATISNDTNNNYFLNTLTEGETVVTCSNEKGNVSRSFNATIYKDGTIIINPIAVGNGESISGKRNFGQYDLDYTKNDAPTKKKAEVKLKIQVLPEEYDQTVYATSKSDFVNFNKIDNTITFDGFGEGEIKFAANESNKINGSYKFNVVENGVNVYNYNDLLNCTNRSETGEVVCLQTNLESLENTYKKDNSGRYVDEYLKLNTKLFGNFDFNSQKTSFKDEVYRFDSTYNTNYIKQYFKEDVGEHDDVITGIHVQKDFYGNGFVINGRELTYPNNGSIDKFTGKLTPNKELGDLFLGPLTFVSIGDFDMPIMKAFGQDNSLMYVNGDNIILDDLNLLNTHRFDDREGNYNIYNLEYTGTCVDVKGKNVTLQNSRLQNARNILRVYDSDGFTLKNSSLEKAREFLMKIGNNPVLKPLKSNTITSSFNNLAYDGNFDEFMKLNKKLAENELSADNLIMSTLISPEGPFNAEEVLKELLKIQEASDKVKEDMSELVSTQNITIEDSYFYRSGIFAIAFDTYFNGPYLYSGIPSIVKRVFGDSVLLPDKMSGVMEPTDLTIKGDTRFYDWKSDDSIDAGCLVQENISGSSIGDMFGDEKINIDDYFPMKYALKKQANAKKYTYKKDDKTFINTPIAWYGGGLNLSSVNYEDVLNKDFGENLIVDITKMALTGEGYNSENFFVNLLGKCVPIASGFNPFRFITNGTYEGTPYLFGQVPQIKDLRNRAK